MKKNLWLVLLIILALAITGCGGGSSSNNDNNNNNNNNNTGTPVGGGIGNITGTVVNFNNSQQGISGVIVKLGGSIATTDSNGKFSFTNIAAGTYTVTASGGSSSTGGLAHLVATVTKTVSGGDNDLGIIPVYNIESYGVTGVNLITTSSVISTMGFNDNRITFTKTALRNSIGNNSFRFQSIGLQPAGLIVRATGSNLLDQNLAYVYLHWLPLSGVTNPIYRIYFGTVEDLNQKVWDSTAVDSSEPFDPNDPKAYLDIGDELAGKVTVAGVYCFLIVVYDSSGNKYKELPAVAVSIGNGSRPIGFQLTGNQLTWNSVSGINGYKVGIYSDAVMTNLKWSSDPNSLLPSSTTMINLPSVVTTNPGDYYCSIMAYLMDDAGWTAEINTGLTAFRYTIP